MERKLTKDAPPILRPWRENWQYWTTSGPDRTWTLAAESPVPSGDGKLRSIYALPSRLVVAFSFWVKAVDAETVRAIAALEIEMKGLIAPERQALQAVVQLLSVRPDETLVRALIFPSRLPEAIDLSQVETFAPAPLSSSLANNTVHVWREGEDFVAAFVWKNQVLCWETLAAASTRTEVESWIRCLIWQMRNELSFGETISLKDWAGALPGLASMNVTEEEGTRGPAIQLPEEAARWQPAELRQAEAARRQKQIFIRLGFAALLLVALALMVPLLISWNIQRQIATLDVEIARNEQEIAPLRAMASKWSEIAPAVDERLSTLAVLHEIVVEMPPGLRLTSFAMSPQQVSIEGHADHVSAATSYLATLQSLQKDHIVWSMSPPALQPDNTAAFVISGSFTNDE